jgi:protein-S-isoprenylcysteine O-methyltransferase Ste14
MRRWTPVLVILLALRLTWVAVELRGGAWETRNTIGLVIMLPALALWALARYQLGASFAVRAKARRLVTTGLYARIRNPIYLFGSFVMFGFIVFFGVWWSLPILAAAVALQAWRAREEARVLEAAFGEQYRAYRDRTWF